MATEIHDGANGSLKKTEVEPLGELKGKAEPPKPVDLCNAADANGKVGCESLGEKDEPILKKVASKSGPETFPKQKGGVVHDVEGEEDVEEPQPQDVNEYTSEEEDAEGEEDEREATAEPFEEEDEEEYVEDDDEDDDDDDESEPPSKRKK